MTELERIQPVSGTKVSIYEKGFWNIDGKQIEKPAAISISDGKKHTVRLSGLQAIFVVQVLNDPEFLAEIQKRASAEIGALTGSVNL